MLRAYHRLLCERPVAVNTLTGSVLGAVGDVVAQRVGHGSSDVDVQHCARATAIAAVMNGLWLPVWYRRLEAAVPGTDARSVVCKSAADVAVNGGFGNATAILARGTPLSEVLRAMPEVLLMDCAVWMPYNFVLFRVVPLHVRPTTTAVMTLFWNTYLSFVAARGRAAFEGQDTGDPASSASGRATREACGT